MKNYLTRASVIALALAAAGAAFAADLPSRKEAPVYTPPPPPPPMWTGFYVGANIGGGWKNNGGSTLAPYTDSRLGGVYWLPGGSTYGSNSGGVVGGGQIGYNFQFGSSIVVGAEADIQGASIGSGGQSNTVAILPSPLVGGGNLTPLATGNNIGVSIPWFGTVRGRAGFLITPTLLVYGTGGFAYGGTQGNVTGFSNTRTGWTAGGGVEWMFMPNWSAKVEYLYVDLDSSGVTGALGYNYGYHHHPQLNVVRAGVNWHFNWGAPTAPVLAKY